MTTLATPIPLCTIDVRIEEGLVLVPAIVNEQRGLFILDTGSTLTSLDTAFAAGAAVAPRDGAVRAQGGGTGAISVSLATASNITLGSEAMHDHTVAVMPFDGIARAFGLNVSGTLGFDVFSRYVVRVDYAAATVSLFDPATFVQESGVEIPVSLDLRLPTTIVDVTLDDGEQVSARLVVDMGTSSVAAQFAPAFVRRHDLVRRSHRVLAHRLARASAAWRWATSRAFRRCGSAAWKRIRRSSDCGRTGHHCRSTEPSAAGFSIARY